MSLLLGTTLGGCAVAPAPLTLEDRNRQIFFDMAHLFSTQNPPDGPITIHQAMARAIRFNLFHRVKIMEEVLSRGMTRIASQQMLPRLATDAGYITQDRLSPLSEQLSNQTGSLSIAWNVLDFGVSYLNAKQQADRTLIAAELRRKAAHTLIQEVRTTFWYAIAAERLKKTIIPLKTKLQEALSSARESEEERIEPPIPTLDFQVTLLETLQKLQQLERELSDARIKLAGLLGLDPGYPFVMVEPEEMNPINIAQLPPIETLEHYALLHRPELWERDYQRRISAYETRKAILRLLPGLEFSQSEKYDNTQSTANSVWAEFGVKLTWNLLNLVTGPDAITLVQDKERMEDFSRLALNMTILAQVHVARRRLTESSDDFAIAARLNEVKERLHHHSQAAQKAEMKSELQSISREGEQILFRTRRDLSFAQLQNTTGTFLLSLGVDILPETTDTMPIDSLAHYITEHTKLLQTGQIPNLLIDNGMTKAQTQTVMGQENRIGAVVTPWVIKKEKKLDNQSLAPSNKLDVINKKVEITPTTNPDQDMLDRMIAHNLQMAAAIETINPYLGGSAPKPPLFME